MPSKQFLKAGHSPDTINILNAVVSLFFPCADKSVCTEIDCSVVPVWVFPHYPNHSCSNRTLSEKQESTFQLSGADPTRENPFLVSKRIFSGL